MPEIIPNWHPAAVHFPIALTITATLSLLLSRLRPASTQFATSARLLLYLAALSALLAAAFGWYAFQTVDHDAAGHLVMVRHRSWALASTGGLLLLALWDGRRQRAGQAAHGALLPALLALSGSLAFTGWLGAEMVYRHGIGVLPSAFASPEGASEPAPPVPIPVPAPAVEAPAGAQPLAEGEHIHKDGKRHRH